MYVDSGGCEMLPFLEVLDGMVKRGVEVRLIHTKAPSPNWCVTFAVKVVDVNSAAIQRYSFFAVCIV